MPPTDEDLAWFQSTFHPIPKPALPEDCIEYSLQIISSSIDINNDSELRLKLREVQKYATELQKTWLKDYIWQRQSFSLQLQKEDGVSFLNGRTEYGDSIEDEWVIVWLLRELTKKFKDLWVKVTDSDGEFLLIEASGTLPAWLEPDVAENRVWINNGQLKIIKPAGSAKSSKRTEEKLTLPDARQIILNESKRLMHSVTMEEEAFYRLRNYPSQIKENMHHSLVTVPRKIAFLLHQKPAYIAPVIEKFYLRDPIALKPLQSKDYRAKMLLPPADLVTISIRFPRVAYAQLKSQDFPPPAVFQDALPSKTEPKAFDMAETGMKITCGFEMLLTDSQSQDDSNVREIKLILDDIATGDETLSTDEEIGKWDHREDDEKWLDISFDDLEQELGGQKGQPEKSKKSEFGDKAAQENLQRIVKQFEQFLNDDKAGPDGAGVFAQESNADLDSEDDLDKEEDESDDEEDKDASFNEDEFSKMMQEMMGMPPEVMKEIMSGQLGPGAKEQSEQKPSFIGPARPPVDSKAEEVDNELSDDDEDMRQMEAELRASGALDLGPSNKNSDGKRQAIKGKGTETEEVDDLSSDDDDIDNEIDVNLARNLLESLKAQGGMAGPGGNLMGLMGLGMPRDEPDEAESSSLNRPKK